MTTLLGFDVFAILMALLKMVNDWIALGEKANKYLGGLAMAFSVALVGWHEIAPLFPPDKEPYVVLILTTVTAFLTAIGFGPGVVGSIKSVHLFVQSRAWAASAEAESLKAQLKSTLKAASKK